MGLGEQLPQDAEWRGVRCRERRRRPRRELAPAALQRRHTPWGTRSSPEGKQPGPGQNQGGATHSDRSRLAPKQLPCKDSYVTARSTGCSQEVKSLAYICTEKPVSTTAMTDSGCEHKQDAANCRWGSFPGNIIRLSQPRCGTL